MMQIKYVLVAAIVTIVIMLSIMSIGTGKKMFGDIQNIKGKMEVLNEIRQELHEQQLAYSEQLKQNEEQRIALETLENTLTINLKEYANTIITAKNNHTKTVAAINTYSSAELKQYFADLPIIK